MPSAALLGVKGGPAIAPGSSMPTSILLDVAGKKVLVDAGLGVCRGICDQGVALPEIDLILITHLHSDHYLELGPFFHTAWVAGLKTPIPVIGPTGLKAYWEGFQASMRFDIELRIEDEGRCDFAPLADIREISEGTVWDEDGLTVFAMRNLHPPIKETYALCIEGEGLKIVLSGDTAAIDEMIPFAEDAHLLVHEALLAKGIDALCESLGVPDGRLKKHLLRSHASAPDVGRIATAAKVGHLALNHMVPNMDPNFTAEDWTKAVRETWDGPLTIGTDGVKIEL